MAIKNCKECGAEVSGSAKACPKCGKDQRNFFARQLRLPCFLLADQTPCYPPPFAFLIII